MNDLKHCMRRTIALKRRWLASVRDVEVHDQCRTYCSGGFLGFVDSFCPAISVPAFAAYVLLPIIVVNGAATCALRSRNRWLVDP